VNPQLQAIVDDLDSASRRLRALGAAVPRDGWDRPPAAGQWSPAECLEHLNLTSAAVVPMLRRALEDARTAGPRPVSSYRRDVMGWLIWTVMAPSNGLKTKTIPAFVPAPTQTAGHLMAEFERLQASVIACVREADGLSIDRIKLESPFDARVKYNLYSVLTLVPRHQHRHLLQAERSAFALEQAPSALAV
jgi:hypothetical protein